MKEVDDMNFTETCKKIDRLKDRIERAEADHNFDLARRLTEELIDLDNSLVEPTAEDVAEWQNWI